MAKVYLGGTCNGSCWREQLIPLLTIKYFNPVAASWKTENIKEEIRQRKLCDYLLYVITPLTTGFYSIAEVVDDSNKRPGNTILLILKNDIDMNGRQLRFSTHEMKSLMAIKKLVARNGAYVAKSLDEVARLLNKSK